MKLIHDGARRLMTQALAAVAATMLLAACGGGERSSDFRPARVIAFGDESSVLDDSAQAGNARKYTVNPVFSASVNCHNNPIWVQYVAEVNSVYFPECSIGLAPGTATPSQMRAQPGADVAAVQAQIDAFLATETLGSKDLVMLYAGVHDVLAQYAAVKGGGTEEAALAAVREAGRLLAAQVNRLADAGGRVMLSFLPGLEFTPFAAAENAVEPAAKRGELLARLTKAFNDEVALGIYNDGTRIGLVQFDDVVRVISEDAGEAASYGYDWPVTRIACLEPQRGANLTECTTDTVVPAAVGRANRWLWADDLHLSAQGHWTLGTLALQVTDRNPF